MRLLSCLALLASAAMPIAAQAAPRTCPWATSWGSSQMVPNPDTTLPAGTLAGATLRQVVRLSVGGEGVRVRFSNAFGKAPLRIGSAHLARPADITREALLPQSGRAITFAGRPGVTIPAGADWWSDPLPVSAAAFGDLAISVFLPDEPDVQTSHPGSRATSYVAKGDHVGDAMLPGAMPTDHWFFLSGVEVRRCGGAKGVVAFGDSITDGYGVKPNTNARWTDAFARRLGGRVAVVNQGIGGNRILLDGSGPNAIARFDRDVLSQAGIGHVILLEGINDIGVLQREKPATAAAQDALIASVTAGYAQMVARAHDRGIKVYGGTVMPFATNGYYHPDAGSERMRQAINAWIRTPGHFDGIVDFDRAMADPQRPDRLAPAYDSGDGLHPSIAGYAAMAKVVPTGWFAGK